jgi:CheY-like chemotaxis protein
VQFDVLPVDEHHWIQFPASKGGEHGGGRMDHATFDVHIAQAAHEGFPWHDLLPVLPGLIWVIIVLALLFWFGDRGLEAFLSRATKIGIAGLEIELSAGIADAASEKGVDVPVSEQSRIARRLGKAKPYFERARMLWIDDVPAGNQNELQILVSLGSVVDLARDDDVAREKLQTGVYDIVLSDMARGQNPNAGLGLVNEIRAAMLAPALIFYVGNPDRTLPAHAFGLTTSPDELFHLIVDALERRRG